MDLSVVVLAAGKGTRMKSATAKVLHGISGKPMLYYVIREARKLSSDVTVVLYHQADTVKSAMQESFNDLTFVMQDHENFPGTGGALMGIRPKCSHLLVLNGDMPLVTKEELSCFLQIEADIVMSVLTLQDPSGYGRVVIKDGQVQQIVEEKDATPEQKAIQTVNAGVYLFKREILEKFLPKLTNNNAQKEYYLTDVIALAKEAGLVIKPLFVDEEDFKGVNSRYDLAHAEEIMQERIKKKWMLLGVTMHLAQTIYIEEDVEFVGDCEIESGVVLKGKTRIENSKILANSIIEESIIKNSSIGPMGRIRPQSVIENSHIGNFVEVKKSTLAGVKAGHLSYLGDSEIGEGTNIGAGTITCNYDGKTKHKTKIGKNVFIGSDTQIVAPVVIEDDVIVAAGTTVTNDLKSGVLGISRTPLKIVEGFFYKFFGKKNT